MNYTIQDPCWIESDLSYYACHKNKLKWGYIKSIKIIYSLLVIGYQLLMKNMPKIMTYEIWNSVSAICHIVS